MNSDQDQNDDDNYFDAPQAPDIISGPRELSPRAQARLAYNAKLEAMVLTACSNEWQKVAVVISKVFDGPEFDKEKNTAAEIAERIYIMVDSGKLDVQGNMRRWRDGAVRILQDQ
jgi:hypothetical protein